MSVPFHMRLHRRPVQWIGWLEPCYRPPLRSLRADLLTLLRRLSALLGLSSLPEAGGKAISLPPKIIVATAQADGPAPVLSSRAFTTRGPPPLNWQTRLRQDARGELDRTPARSAHRKFAGPIRMPHRLTSPWCPLARPSLAVLRTITKEIIRVYSMVTVPQTMGGPISRRHLEPLARESGVVFL
jgi:hypothetical protein